MSNPFNLGDEQPASTTGAGENLESGSIADEFRAMTDSSVDGSDLDGDTTSDTTFDIPEDTTDATTFATDGDVSLNLVVDLMSDAGIDTIWLDLDGDLIPETSISIDGPFEVDPTAYDHDYDLWMDYQSIDPYDYSDISGGDMNALLPIDISAGYPDPFQLYEADWTSCDCYDPMAVPADWSMDGYSTYSDPWAMDGWDTTWTDSGDFYDASAYNPGYWDASYYEASGDYLDSSQFYDTWDMPVYDATGYDMGYDATGYDPNAFSTGYDPSAFTSTGYESYNPTSYSTWDPNAGDAAHDAFISTITEDYSTGSDDYSFWMDQYNQAEQLSWDAWNNSVDSYLADDGVASYDWNQVSLEANSYADQAWNYANDASYTSSYTSSYSGGYSDAAHDSFIDYIQS